MVRSVLGNGALGSRNNINLYREVRTVTKDQIEKMIESDTNYILGLIDELKEDIKRMGKR